MLILVVVMVMTVTEFVARAVAAALDGMDEMVFTEEGKGAEDVRLVDGHNPSFQLSQRERLYRSRQGLDDKDTVGRRLDTVLL